MILRARGLSRRFGGVIAVDEVDLTLQGGEILGLIGPNGAGKTTLVDLLSGHARPDRGTIQIERHDLAGRPPERFAARGLARTFQQGRIWGDMSVLDNVLAGMHLHLRHARPGQGALAGAPLELLLALLRPARVRAEEHEAIAAAHRILARFGRHLAPRAAEPAHGLSYANRRRLEIARALALRPGLLLLDEPAAGMNPAETDELARLIAALRDEGIGILLIEHKLAMVMALADRVVVMQSGRVLAEGRPAAIREDPAVIEAYLGHSRDLRATPQPLYRPPADGPG